MLRLAIPRIPVHVSSPYLYVFLDFILFIIPKLPCLVLHGWSHGGFYSEVSIAMEYHLKWIIILSSTM